MLENAREFYQVNKRLLIAVAIALAGLAGLQGYINSAATACLGVADAKETTVAFETPVIVKKIFVLPGQIVKKGQALIEVDPAEINLKLAEVQTEIRSLKTELKLRETLLSSFGRRSIGATENPLSQQIAGLERQVDVLMRQKAQAVRYAEEDGVVATVAFRPREQVPPFMPVITINSNVPNLVYGFIHENRVAEFKVNDRVVVEPVGSPERRVYGKVISLGNRIAPFPERFQVGTTQRPTYFGREVMVSLPKENHVLIGEKVTIHVDGPSTLSDFGFHAFAATEGQSSTVIAQGLELEAGGLTYLAESDSLLVVSDDDGPSGSPFWTIPLANPIAAQNLPMEADKKVEDLESLTADGGVMYSMSSLAANKKGEIKPSRNLVLRVALRSGKVVVDRSLPIREPLIAALTELPVLSAIAAELDKLEVEAFTVFGGDAYIALKQPQLPDGSSVIVKMAGFAAQMEAGVIRASAEVHNILKLETTECTDPARITDLVKTETGLLVLSNCRKSEKTGQLWWLADGNAPGQMSLLTTFRSGRPEGLSFGADRTVIYASSDNGKKGSDLIKLTTPPLE